MESLESPRGYVCVAESPTLGSITDPNWASWILFPGNVNWERGDSEDVSFETGSHECQ